MCPFSSFFRRMITIATGVKNQKANKGAAINIVIWAGDESSNPIAQPNVELEHEEFIIDVLSKKIQKLKLLVSPK